jgi:hypothetical protein
LKNVQKPKARPKTQEEELNSTHLFYPQDFQARLIGFSA